MGENNNNNNANRLKIPHPLPSFYHFSYGPSLIWIVVVGRLGEKDGTGWPIQTQGVFRRSETLFGKFRILLHTVFFVVVTRCPTTRLSLKKPTLRSELTGLDDLWNSVQSWQMRFPCQTITIFIIFIGWNSQLSVKNRVGSPLCAIGKTCYL